MTEAPDEEYDNRWNLYEEMQKPFKTALQLSFPDLSNGDKVDPGLITMGKKEMGDYYCHKVLSMCSNKTPETMLLKHTAEAIKNNLPPNDMIEDCYIHSIGFLTYRLSTTWIAKSVHKMLNEGIQTWALKLPIKKAVVNVPSRNKAEEMNMGHLRATIIGEMLVRMLEFCNVHVQLTNHSRDSNQGHYNFYSYCRETLSILRQKEGLVEEHEGDEVILVKEVKTIRHLNFERKTKPLTVVKENGDYDNALRGLSTLRYQLKEQNAEWIVFVADVGEKEYFEMCFTAAKRAGWLPTDEDEHPKTTFVGCGLVQINDLNKSGKLVDLVDYVKTRCKAVLLDRVKAGDLIAEELENTVENLACGAVNYALMKDFRIFNHTLNVDEMLNDKGNTGVYLLYTHAQICSIINKSGKDIEELKKTRELTLEKDEERELGLYLLLFTEDLGSTCKSLFPSMLCAYLYELSMKFTSFYSVVCQDVGGDDEEANKLLVCEATRVVMTKCFQLLGISPISKISISDKNMTIPPPVERDDDVMESFSSDEDKEEMVSTSSSVEDKEDIVSSSTGEVKTPTKRFKISNSTLEEEEKNMTLPLEPITSSEDSTLEEERNPNMRFQLFSAYVHVDKYKSDHKTCFLFGSIAVSDMFVSSEENGWVLIFDPDYGYTDLFEREWYEAVPIVNNSYINTLTHPKTQRSIPFIDFLEICADLHVFNEDDNILFRVSHGYTCLDLSNTAYNKFSTLRLTGPDGVVEMVYYVLSDPVDATFDMTLATQGANYDVSKKSLSVKILAYYDDAGQDSSSICLRKDSYYLTLLEDDCVVMSDNNQIPLNTSVMAVPANKSLVIDVLIKDANGNMIVKEMFEFHAQRKGSRTSSSEGVGGGYIFKLDVNWKCQAAE